MSLFKKNTAVTGFPFTLISAADGSAITTGTPVGYVTLDGGAQTAIGDVTPVHEGNGQWTFDLTAAEMNGDVVGFLITHASAINVHFTIKTDTKIVSELNDVAATDVVSSGAITTLAGAVANVDTVDTLTTYTGNTPQTGDNYARLGAPAGASVSADIAEVKTETASILTDTASIGVTKNAAFSNFEFPMVLTSDHYTAATGKTVTGQRSIDGGAFASVSGAIAEVGNGIYQVDLLAADTNGDVITYRFSAADSDDTFVTIKTRA